MRVGLNGRGIRSRGTDRGLILAANPNAVASFCVSATHWSKEANGLTATHVLYVLEKGVFSGNPTLIAEGLRLLRALDKFRDTVPRGAQTWEVPLHTPNILASAYLVRAYTFGYETTGIKLHAAIDVQIHHNRIHNTTLGTWLDWQAQGVRVSSNLYYDNDCDLMVEVSHGPYLVDNNIFASDFTFENAAQGGARRRLRGAGGKADHSQREQGAAHPEAPGRHRRGEDDRRDRCVAHRRVRAAPSGGQAGCQACEGPGGEADFRSKGRSDTGEREDYARVQVIYSPK